MNYRSFLTFNVAGGILWASGVPLAGYAMGKSVPNIDKYLLPVIALIVVLSLIPVALEAARHRRASIT